MLNFPTSTEFGRVIPKETFYKNLSLTAEMKDKFVADIKRIVWQYKLSKSTLNITKGENVTEIQVLIIELKKQDFDTKILEQISKQNSNKVLYIVNFDNQYSLALWYNKVYLTKWVKVDELSLDIVGFNLDTVWDNFLSQIAIDEKLVDTNKQATINELLQIQEEKQKLQKKILVLENKIRNSKQFNTQVKLKNELKKLKERF